MGPLFLSLGQLQGEGRYGPYAVTFALWGVPRPLFLIPLALLGLGVYAAVGATALAVGAAATWGAAVTLDRASARPGRPTRRTGRVFTRALPPVVVGLSSVAFLTNLDVVAAKLFLDAHRRRLLRRGGRPRQGRDRRPPGRDRIVLLPRIAARRAQGGDTGPPAGPGRADHPRRRRRGGAAVPSDPRPGRRGSPSGRTTCRARAYSPRSSWPRPCSAWPSSSSPTTRRAATTASSGPSAASPILHVGLLSVLNDSGGADRAGSTSSPASR